MLLLSNYWCTLKLFCFDSHSCFIFIHALRDGQFDTTCDRFRSSWGSRYSSRKDASHSLEQQETDNLHINGYDVSMYDTDVSSFNSRSQCRQARTHSSMIDKYTVVSTHLVKTAEQVTKRKMLAAIKPSLPYWWKRPMNFIMLTSIILACN